MYASLYVLHTTVSMVLKYPKLKTSNLKSPKLKIPRNPEHPQPQRIKTQNIQISKKNENIQNRSTPKLRISKTQSIQFQNIQNQNLKFTISKIHNIQKHFSLACDILLHKFGDSSQHILAQYTSFIIPFGNKFGNTLIHLLHFFSHINQLIL